VEFKEARKKPAM